MGKRVILVTGTPCVGKTTVSLKLTKRLNAKYINLNEFAKEENLISKQDKQRKTAIINEAKMRKKLAETLATVRNGDVIVDGHYASAVVSKSFVTNVFVLRRNPVELRVFMEKCGFIGDKLWENLASEILDVCLLEALNNQEQQKICELDITGKTAEDVTNEIVKFLDNPETCAIGVVDWLGVLEKQGVLGEYLRV